MDKIINELLIQVVGVVAFLLTFGALIGLIWLERAFSKNREAGDSIATAIYDLGARVVVIPMLFLVGIITLGLITLPLGEDLGNEVLNGSETARSFKAWVESKTGKELKVGTFETEAPVDPAAPSPTEVPVTPEVQSTPLSYTIVGGDWLSKIADRHGVTVDEILAINPQITDSDHLSVGQVIQLPVK